MPIDLPREVERRLKLAVDEKLYGEMTLIWQNGKIVRVVKKETFLIVAQNQDPLT